MDRAMMFLRMAETLAPLRSIDCGDGQGPVMGLVYCLGPPDLSHEQRGLMLDRLTLLVEDHGPAGPLPVCMEDEACSACLKVLGEAMQAGRND